METLDKCDIAIDQMLVGAIGTFAFEVMGKGKCLVTYLANDIVEKYMHECPIVEADIYSLTDKLEFLLTNREEVEIRGRQGVIYCRAYLDYDKIQAEILSIYENLVDKNLIGKN